MFGRILIRAWVIRRILKDMRRHGSTRNFSEAISREVLDAVLSALECLERPITFSGLEHSTDYTRLWDLRTDLRALPEPPRDLLRRLDLVFSTLAFDHYGRNTFLLRASLMRLSG